MLKIKSESGITVTVLIIMVIVMLIISGTVITTVNNYTNSSAITRMQADVEVLRDKVIMYYQKYGTLPVTGSELSEKIPDAIKAGTYYEIDLTRLDNLVLNFGYKEDGEDDIYIVNESNFEVYYLAGIKSGDKTIYSVEYNNYVKDKMPIELALKVIPHIGSIVSNSGTTTQNSKRIYTDFILVSEGSRIKMDSSNISGYKVGFSYYFYNYDGTWKGKESSIGYWNNTEQIVEIESPYNGYMRVNARLQPDSNNLTNQQAALLADCFTIYTEDTIMKEPTIYPHLGSIDKNSGIVTTSNRRIYTDFTLVLEGSKITMDSSNISEYIVGFTCYFYDYNGTLINRIDNWDNTEQIVEIESPYNGYIRINARQIPDNMNLPNFTDEQITEMLNCFSITNVFN